MPSTPRFSNCSSDGWRRPIRACRNCCSIATSVSSEGTRQALSFVSFSRPDSMNAGTEIRFDRELDARGLNCPLPILRTKKSLNDMATGQVLKIVATDPGSVRDFQAFSRQTGNQLLLSNESGGEYLFMMRKK